MKLIDIKEITGKIIIESGLHIGAGDTEMHIGGTDSPIVKHPHSDEPYIPGSSIKGKVRSLLELKSGLIGKTGGKPLQAKDLTDVRGDARLQGEQIIKLFGNSGADSDASENLGPTRVSFADCPISDSWKTDHRNAVLTEVKSENSINRIKGTADSPRFTERVPSGVEFNFSVTLKVLEGDEGLFDVLLSGLKLLEMDSLGGSGSRGYGRVKFIFDDEETNKNFLAISAF